MQIQDHWRLTKALNNTSLDEGKWTKRRMKDEGERGHHTHENREKNGLIDEQVDENRQKNRLKDSVIDDIDREVQGQKSSNVNW